MVWVEITLAFFDGEETFRSRVALWFPSGATSCIHLKLEVNLDPNTNVITGTLRVRHGLPGQHHPDDEFEHV